MSVRSSVVRAQPTASPGATPTASVSSGLPLLPLGTTAIGGFSNPFAKKPPTNSTISSLLNYDWFGKNDNPKAEYDAITRFVEKTTGDAFKSSNTGLMEEFVTQLNSAEDILKKRLADDRALLSLPIPVLGQKIGSIELSLHLVKVIRDVFQSNIDQVKGLKTEAEAVEKHKMAQEKVNANTININDQEDQIHIDNVKSVYHKLKMESANADVKKYETSVKQLRRLLEEEQTKLDMAETAMKAEEEDKNRRNKEQLANLKTFGADLTRMHNGFLPEHSQNVFKVVIKDTNKRRKYQHALDEFQRTQSNHPSNEQEDKPVLDAFQDLVGKEKVKYLEESTLKGLIKEAEKKVKEAEEKEQLKPEEVD